MLEIKYNIFFFKKFSKIYNYKIFIYISNKNFYCYLLSFFKFNIILSLSTLSIILKNYIIINFGKFLNYKIYSFIGKCFYNIITNLKINSLNFKIYRNYNFKKFKFFLNYLKNFHIT